MDPAIRRIALIDGPSAIGWQEQRAIDQRDVRSGCSRPSSTSSRRSTEMLGHVLFATLNELGLYVANATDGSSAHTRAVVALDVVLARLFGAAR